MNSRHPDPRRVWKGGPISHPMTPDPWNPRNGDTRDNSRPPLPLQTSIEKLTSGPPGRSIFKDFPGKAPREPKATQREHKRALGRSKASQTGTKATLKRDQWTPMASQRNPLAPKRGFEGSLYTKNPDQPHPAEVMLLDVVLNMFGI